MQTIDNMVTPLLEWYATHYRPLPWRQHPTPYRVWVSEIMLQQTRIEAVMPYYERFMQAVPDVAALASIAEDELLKLWEGLGYYSRARNLQKCARLLMDKYGGQLPADYDSLVTLPGIGPYTAGAIASIAYHIPVPAVDGNVMRVLARLTADDTDVLSGAGKRHFTALAGRLVPQDQPGRFNQAIMELGETVCIPATQPHCEMCPLAFMCLAHASGKEQALPVRTAKKSRRIERRTVAVVRVVGDPMRVLLHRRADTGLLAGLWELPNVLADKADLLPSALDKVAVYKRSLPSGKHVFSHVEWHMTGALYDMPNGQLPPDYRAVTLEELVEKYALPIAFRTYAAWLPQLLEGDG